MLFQKRLADKILNREKTQTRRIVKEGERFQTFPPLPTTVLDANGRIKWQVGRDYAIQIKRGGKAVGRFWITDIRREIVAQISDEDAKAEGFAGRNEFFIAWESINKQSNANEYCWVIEFNLHLTV
jgi:hypothetical protein